MLHGCLRSDGFPFPDLSMHVFRRDLRRQPQDWLDHGCVSANLPCTIPFAFTGAVLPPTQHVASRVSMCHLGPDFSDAHADGCLHSDGNLPAIRPQSNRNPIAIRSQSDGGAGCPVHRTRPQLWHRGAHLGHDDHLCARGRPQLRLPVILTRDCFRIAISPVSSLRLTPSQTVTHRSAPHTATPPCRRTWHGLLVLPLVCRMLTAACDPIRCSFPRGFRHDPTDSCAPVSAAVLGIHPYMLGTPHTCVVLSHACFFLCDASYLLVAVPPRGCTRAVTLVGLCAVTMCCDYVL